MTNSVRIAQQPKPDAKPPTAPKPMTKPALVVYGADSLSKPHASWFPAEEQEAAVKAAGVMGFSTLVVTSDEQVELARKLPRGRIFDGGKAFVPFVKHVLHEKIAKLAADPPRADQSEKGQEQTDGTQNGEPVSSPVQEEQPTAAAPPSPDSSPAPESSPLASPSGGLPTAPPPSGSTSNRRPNGWDEITVGHLVLAYDPETEGWFEAIVLGNEGELLRLRWRDYPLERIAPQRRDRLALLPPTA